MNNKNPPVQRARSAALAFVVIVVQLAACGRAEKAPGAPGSQPAQDQGAQAEQGKKAGAIRLQGAGASFPAPLYLKWFKDYAEKHPDVLIDYQSVGSGSGVKSVIDRTVDFGASDAAMTDEEVARVSGGVQLLPMTAGSIVLAYNLEGIKDLKLSRKAYIGIFRGTVKQWNDPAIAEANPGVKLPDKPIGVIVRADSSGTTFVFTKHLSEISPEFKASPGTNKMPAWPVGVRSKGNEGVTAGLKTTPGSIGYVEYGYAKNQNLAMATLENRAGKFVAPTTASGQAALATAKMPASLVTWASDPDAPEAYPIVTYTWMILYQQYPDQRKRDALRDLITFAATDGQQSAERLGYIPLPSDVADKVVSAMDNVKVAAAAPAH